MREFSVRAIRRPGGIHSCCALLSLAAAVMLLVAAAPAGVGKPAVHVTLVEDTQDHVVLHYSFGGMTQNVVSIDGTDYVQIGLGKESQIVVAGAPDLPNVCRSVIIPDDAAMEVKVVSAEFYELGEVLVAPSKGHFPRSVDPADVLYEFGPVYEVDADYPGTLATLSEPYVLRDYRGVVVRVNPFQYNPVARTLRVYTAMTVEVVNTGPGVVNVLERPADERQLSLAFHEIYQNQFLNYNSGTRYDPLDEVGDLLIICYDAWMPNVQPLVDHKNDIGIDTTMVGVSTIGNNATLIKNHILSVYSSSDLAFVLLVGDIGQITAFTAVSGYNGASDPSYSTLTGNDDYPEIIVGRFSAETPAQVDTQVERTIEYENMPATTQDWFWRGMGVASNLGSGIGDEGQADNVHMAEIRTWLLGYGYTAVDEIYDPSADAGMVTAGLNAGRGVINYCGHGNIFAWSTTGFDTYDVDALTNDNMLPFIVSVACNNGEFDGYTCFAEAWLRATNGSEPTGAIGMYASSISHPWAPPMEGQDEFNLLYTAESYHSYGALCYAGSCSMMDHYPGSSDMWGTGPATFLTWHIFGDPSLRVVGTVEPPTGLKVTGDDLVTSGHRGGPYTPSSMVYQLENRNETPIDYEVTATVTWVDITNASGTIPGLTTIDVTVSLNEEANGLPHGLHEGTLYFVNLTDHDGDDERLVSIDVDATELRHSFPLDADPLWTAEGQWEFGQPTGGGTHNRDPDSGHTGSNVLGYNLGGDYASDMPEYYLTTAANDCSDLAMVELRFWRWLGVESSSFDHAAIEVSDGGPWTEVWVNPGVSISDTSWTQVVYDISAIAAGQPTVYVRWKMGPTDGMVTYPGWNIDDVEIWGIPGEEPMVGDLDGDGDVDLSDLSALLAVYGLCSEDPGFDPAADFDDNGCIDLSDLSALLANYGLGG